jgi:CheY-like chemotaxis protein
MKLFKKTDEITALRTELAEVKAQAENANRVNRNASAFFAAVSHEIRTPMNAIAGMSELLSEDAVTTAQFEKIEIIKSYSHIMLGIIDDLLDFSRIERGSFELYPEHYSLPVLLENITSAARLAAREKALEFTTVFPAEIPPYLYGDSAKLSRALSNLLSNAVKFTEKGSVTLSLIVNEGTLIFTVRDTGIGIRPEDCRRLFDVFEQVEERKNKGLAGLGLGLTITDNIVRVMDGKLSVDSVYGEGSAFKIEIPFAPGDEEQAEFGAVDTSYVFAPEAKILLVDDIDVNLSVGTGFMKLHGIIPDTAVSGKEAIKKVCENEYDIVFMDYMMPDTDGGKASEIIRSFGGKYAKSNKPGNLKIIALTANVSPEARALLLESGMDDYLTKPVTKQALNLMFMKWLSVEKYAIIERNSINPAEEKSAPEDEPLFAELAEKAINIDIKLGFLRSGGTAEAYKNSLWLLYRRIPKSLERLNEYLSSGKRLRDFRVEVHGMKGALAINGLESLASLAYELELAAENNNVKVCKENFPAFTEKLERLKDALAEAFPEKDETNEVKNPGDAGLLNRITDDLIEIIERFDRAAALEEIENARKLDFGNHSALFELLKEDLEEYDYDSAMEKLHKFKNGEEL